MRKILSVVIIAASLSACAESTAPNTLLSEREVTADIAASAGDAIAGTLEGLVGNQLAGSLPFVASHSHPGGHDVNHERSRTCLDAAGAVVAGCSPLSSVRKIITQLSMSGTRSGTRTRDDGVTVTFSGSVKRTLLDTLTRNFNTAQPPAEVSRTHSAVATAFDTTNFSDGTVTRRAAEAALDSVRALTFALPRSSNPWPVSGSVVRRVGAAVTITRGDKTESRSFAARIQVTFPADAQGNVALQINDKNCTLNLVTRKVTGCQ